MKSISGKILRAILYWLVIIILLMAIVTIAAITKTTKTDSELLITQVCEKESLIFNDEFKFLENSVTTVSKYISNLEEGNTSEQVLFSDEFCKKVQEMTLSIANRTDGAMAVYFRYNPELTGNGTQGFFWSRNNDKEDFSYFEPTDILLYDQNDIEHVGWFYEPKKSHEPIWMSPYYNKNLGVFMISYIVPYYTKAGNFLGVIGMDIDFDKIVQLTNKVSLYQSGKINLIDLSNHLIYSASKENYVKAENLSEKLYEHVMSFNDDKTISMIKADSGKCYLTCVNHLQNGMRLILSVPSKEVFVLRHNMLITFAIILVIVLAVTVIFIVRFTNRMINPLKKLTRVTEKYATGDWSETFICNTNDEIQELSESIYVMAGITKSYIEKINENAMTDALTGLKNKNCYLSYVKNFKEKNDSEKNEYAVVVFDINYLKRTNDKYGHETGDKLIKLAGEYICNIFKHSPVFRIGGDEFTIILEKKDYLERENLCQKFETEIKNEPPVTDDIPLSISYGMAVFGKDGTAYEEIFKCADERMYEYKKAIKAGRE